MVSTHKNEDLADVVSRAPWFDGLPAEAHRSLAESGIVRTYAKNSYLFTAGQITSDIYCIISGRIRLLITSAIGQEFALTDLEPESWLNEAGLAGELPRMLDAKVIDAARVLTIPAQSVKMVGERYPQMYRKLFVDHVLRTRGIYLLLTGMAFYPLRARLAGWLLQLVKEHGRETADGVQLDVNLSQNDLAQLSLGSRQRINKILGEWREAGIIELRANQYVIYDLDALTGETQLKDSDD